MTTLTTLLLFLITLHMCLSFYCGPGTTCDCYRAFDGLSASCNLSANDQWPSFMYLRRKKIDLTVHFVNMTASWTRHLSSQGRHLRGFRSVNLYGKFSCRIKFSFATCHEQSGQHGVYVSITLFLFYNFLFVIFTFWLFHF
jgi:hypothetical protein